MTTPATAAAPVNLLLVEDSPPDILFAREIVTELPYPVVLDVVRDGEQALAYLRREDPTSRRAIPTSSCSTSTCRARAASRS